MAEDSGTGAPMTAERLAELRRFRAAWTASRRLSNAFDVEFELLAEVDRLRAELAEATKPGKWYPPRDDMTLTGGSFTTYDGPPYGYVCHREDVAG